MIPTNLGGVELRALTPDDAPAFHALLQANREHLLRLNDDHLPQINMSQAEHAARFGDPAGRDILLGIWEHQRLVGHIALVHGEPPRWGLGYWLAEAATGRGLATAAVDSLLDHAAAELGATEVLAGVSHGNDKSVAVLRRCGFEPVERFETYTRFRCTYPRRMDEVERVPAEEMDDEFVEGWWRLTDEPDVRAVEGYRSDDDDWPWNVVVSVAEFIREDPLETELRDGVEAAIRAVAGVKHVEQEDREVWLVSGSPDGRALVAAVASFVDELAPRSRLLFDE